MGENIKLKQSSTIQWHDLTKDSEDLPESFKEVLDENGTKVYYDIVNEKWYMFRNNFVVRANTPKFWCEIPKLENKTESQEHCETAILKDVIITDAECSAKHFYYELSNGIRRLDKVVNTLVFCVNSFGTFCYKTENFVEIEKIMKGIRNKKHFTITYNTSSRTVLKIFAETNGVTSQCLKETEKEDKELSQQLVKCSDKIKELEQKIVKKKKKISELKSKNSHFKDTINNLVSENKYLKDKYETLGATCIEANKCITIIKEILISPNLSSETKLSEIRKTLS